MSENQRNPWVLFAELTEAVERGDAEAVVALLQAGAQADAVEDLDDPTLLMRAAEQGRLEVVKALVEGGANVNAEADDPDLDRRYGEKIAEAAPGVSALLYAGLNNHAEVFNYLQARVEPKLRGRVERILETAKRLKAPHGKNRGAKALCEAALRGDLEAVRDRLAAGADIDAQYRNGSTALTLAAALDNYEMAAYLLEAGANAGLATHEGMTAIHCTRNPLIIAALLNHGADPNAEENYGRRPLHFACGRRHDQRQAQALISAGADVNAPDESGETPLHLGAQFAPAPVVMLLIDAGADLQARTKEGATPLTFASDRRDPEAAAVVAALRNAGAT
ncbi:MAG TPA: ankyrin repeat domain-containing protein [Pirellulales bacterium]|nr:ankyrin repeat domain-containing protein [Pirellulales bacterium]